MKKFTNILDPNLIDMLQRGSIGVLLTDTLYGLVARANDADAVERVYEARGRDREKPCIVLIEDTKQIWDKDSLTATHSMVMEQHWPGKVSIILPIAGKTPDFVHRGHNGTVAFRMPDDLELRRLLAQTGPLIAPSANIAGQPPATDIAQAEAYFGDRVDFYVDSGPRSQGEPSRLLQPEPDGTVRVLR
jgi:L-threonylcarbamoyladenylate synthase